MYLQLIDYCSTIIQLVMVYTISHSLGCKDQSITTEPGNFALYHAYDAYHPYHILKTVSTLSGITIHSLFPSAEGKPVRIIYENPIFWTEERLQEKSHLFHNVATTFGVTDLKDSKGRTLYLYGVDIDSKQAYEALKDLLETLKAITFVVKSHKEYGYHFYILTPVFHEAMGPASFKLGAEIEIKTDL